MSEILIKTIHLSKQYQMGESVIDALDNISFEVKRGEDIAILGPSGSGKSTLMNLLGCLDTPTTGAYFLDGEEVSQLGFKALARIRNKKIGFIFQGFHLLPHATAIDNVALPLLYNKVPLAQRREKALEMLTLVGLRDRAQHHPNALSGGQQQRVAIARALINDPQMILADEPTGNLDSTSGKAIMKLFADLLDKGKTILTVTHDMNIAKNMQRTIYISDGKMHHEPITSSI